jgi:hypothetical protein
MIKLIGIAPDTNRFEVIGMRYENSGDAIDRLWQVAESMGYTYLQIVKGE